MSFFLVLVRSENSGLHLGALKDCTRIQPKGIYQPPLRQACVHPVDSEHELEHFHAEVYKYEPRQTQIIMYLCRKIRVYSECRNPLFSRMVSNQNTEYADMPVDECLGMIQDKKGYDNADPRVGIYGKTDYTKRTQIRVKMERHGNNYWIAPKIPLIDCSEGSRQRYEVNFRSLLRTYPALVTGVDKYVEQNYGNTHCPSLNHPHYETMKSRNKTIKHVLCNNVKKIEGKDYVDSTRRLIYFPYEHNTNLFKSVGVHLGHQLGRYITFPSLAIGGMKLHSNTIEKANNLVHLDNGYAFIIRNTSGPNILNHFNDIIKHARFAANERILPIVEGHVLTAIMNQELLLQNQHHQLCNVASQEQRLISWMLQHFPSFSARWIDPLGEGHISPLGDAILISKCPLVSDYTIIWSRVHNNTCFDEFPVIVEGFPDVKFLILSDRQLVAKGTQIPCSKVPSITFVRLPNDTYMIVDKAGNYKRSTDQIPVYDEKHTLWQLKEMTGVNYEALRKVRVHLPPLTISTLLGEAQDMVDELHKTRKEFYSPNIIESIGMAIGHIIHEASAGVNSIIKTIGKSMVQVIKGVSNPDDGLIAAIKNTTVSVIKQTGNTIAQDEKSTAESIMTILGGIRGVIITAIIALILGIILFLLVKVGQIRGWFRKRNEPHLYDNVETPIVALDSATVDENFGIKNARKRSKTKRKALLEGGDAEVSIPLAELSKLTPLPNTPSNLNSNA